MSWFRSKPITWLELHFGPALDEAAATAFIVNVLADHRIDRLIFETESTSTATSWRIGTTHQRVVHRLLKTHLGEIEVTSATRDLEAPLRSWRVRVNTSSVAMNTSDPSASSAALLGALAVSGGAKTFHQLVIGRRAQPQMVPAGYAEIPGNSITNRTVNGLVAGKRHLDTDARRAMRNKRQLLGASVTVRMALHDPDDAYRQLPAGYLAAWRSVTTPGLRFRIAADRADNFAAATAGWFGTVQLNSEEISTMLGWPYGDRSYPRVDRDRSVTLPIALAGPLQGKLLGNASHPGQHDQQLKLGVRDALRHVAITGPTGVGKSTLLLNLALTDIAEGHSVIVFDPKGDLVNDLLARIPNQHLARTVLLDPSQKGKVVGFNPLAVPPAQRHLAADGIVHVFKNLHSRSWGPRSEDILHASLLTLGAIDGASLIEIPELLIDPHRRHRQLETAELSKPLRLFWEWFDQLSASERSHITAPLLNKLRPFTLRPSLSNMLSTAEPFQLQRVFTEHLVLLVPLRKGDIGTEAAQLFGSMVTANLWQTIQTRSSIDPKRRHPAFVYADEFHEYTRMPTDFADVLAQSRGFGVGWALAHQNHDQLSASLRTAVAANAQSKIYFRLSNDDAAHVARHANQLRPSDLARLPAFEAYAQLLRNDQLLPFASIRTAPAPKPIRNPTQTASAITERWGSSTKPPDSEPENEPGTVGRRKRGPS